jgi:hypothetical protein
MSRRVTYFNSSRASILNPSQIFGANYYDDWDFNEPTSLNLTGSLINSVASLTGSGRNFTSSGGARPTLTADTTLGKNVAAFDGLSSFMFVPTSTALYNFLHNAQGGCLIMVFSLNSILNPDRILNNRGTIGTETAPGVQITYRPNENTIRNAILADALQTVASTDSTQTIQANHYTSIVNSYNANNVSVVERLEHFMNNVKGSDNEDTASFLNANAGYNLTLGRRVRLNDIYFGGKIARLIIANATPTPTQLTQLQAYLNNYYGTFPIS